MSYSDPQISSFTIFDDRNDMEQTISLPEYGMRIYFTITNKQSMPVPLDSKYGSFSLSTLKYWYSDQGLHYESVDVGVREVDFMNETDHLSFFDGTPNRGMMTAKNESLMSFAFLQLVSRDELYN